MHERFGREDIAGLPLRKETATRGKSGWQKRPREADALFSHISLVWKGPYYFAMKLAHGTWLAILA
jgi:hypothetical protein